MRPFYPLFLLKIYKKIVLLFFINIAACYAFVVPPRFYISGETTVCYGNEEVYTVGGIVRCPAYSWSVLGGNIVSSGHNYIVVHWVGADEGEVSVSTPGCGVMYSASITVFIGNSRQPDMPAVTNNCGSTVLTRGTPPMEVTWYWQTSPQGRSRANANTTYTCTASTTVYLRAYDGNSGCWSPATSIPVTVSQPPDFTVTGNTAICHGTSTQLTAGGSNDISYSWSPVTGLSDPSIANPWASPTQTTIYTITGTLNGCSTTKQVTVQVAPAFVAAISTQTGADLSTVLRASNQTNQLRIPGPGLGQAALSAGLLLR